MTALTKRDILAHRGEIVCIARAHGAAEIQLFGSVARDTADETSDVISLSHPRLRRPRSFPGA